MNRNWVNRVLAGTVFCALVSGVSAGEGQVLFRKKLCGSCHAISADKKAKLASKGTYLGDVGSRRSAAWMMKYLADTEAAVKKSPELKKLRKKFKKPMKNPRLNAAQVKDLTEYLMTLK